MDETTEQRAARERAFNPLLLQCLTDIQAALKEELQQHN